MLPEDMTSSSWDLLFIIKMFIRHINMHQKISLVMIGCLLFYVIRLLCSYIKTLDFKLTAGGKVLLDILSKNKLIYLPVY